jgi:DNA-binding FadR family transcriptional regulator
MNTIQTAPQSPHEIWEQHAGIATAVLEGDAANAERLMNEHAIRAAQLLASNATNTGTDQP